MRICQICAVDFTLRHFLLPLVDAMQSQNWIVDSVCSAGPNTQALRAAGYTVRTVEIARTMNPVSALISTVQLVMLFRTERYDVVHVHTPVAAVVGRLAAWIVGVPLVIYTAHGFYFHEGMPAWQRRIFIWLEKMAGFWTDLLFTQSSEDAETAILEKIMPHHQVLAIGNGVSAKKFNFGQVGNRGKIRL
jgi:hypothetical protein